MIIIERGKKWKDSGYYELKVLDPNSDVRSDSLKIITEHGDIVCIDMPQKDIIRILPYNCYFTVDE